MERELTGIYFRVKRDDELKAINKQMEELGWI